MNAQIPIMLNGHDMKVYAIRFDEAGIMEDEYYHDAHITFSNGVVERYDACDVVMLRGKKEMEEYKCEVCSSYISECEGITTLNGLWVCDKNTCRTLDEENQAKEIVK